jgi:hypothetical protein
MTDSPAAGRAGDEDRGVGPARPELEEVREAWLRAVKSLARMMGGEITLTHPVFFIRGSPYKTNRAASESL